MGNDWNFCSVENEFPHLAANASHMGRTLGAIVRTFPGLTLVSSRRSAASNESRRTKSFRLPRFFFSSSPFSNRLICYIFLLYFTALAEHKSNCIPFFFIYDTNNRVHFARNEFCELKFENKSCNDVTAMILLNSINLFVSLLLLLTFFLFLCFICRKKLFLFMPVFSFVNR